MELITAHSSLKPGNIYKFKLEIFSRYGNYNEKQSHGQKEASSYNKVKDYSNDPFFVKKREAALKLLKKTGLPDSFDKK